MAVKFSGKAAADQETIWDACDPDTPFVHRRREWSEVRAFQSKSWIDTEPLDAATILNR